MRVLIVTGFAAIVGCVVGGGYDGGASVGYDVGFYEPFGYDYGGCGPGYGVAPHASYRPAALSRSTPSLPWHSRGRWVVVCRVGGHGGRTTAGCGRG
jgi:hypothetical protein